MQITLNQNELQGVLAAYVVSAMPSVEPEEVKDIVINDDGTATIHIGEEVGHEDDTPPVVEKQKRTRGPNKRNPQEAKHRPVETPTTVGGQNANSTPEPESVAAEPAEQGEEVQTPDEALKEEATAEAEAAASQEVAEEAAVQEEVQEKVEAEKPATAKPSLFAGLKR
jgi:hypothetical protein